MNRKTQTSLEQKKGFFRCLGVTKLQNNEQKLQFLKLMKWHIVKTFDCDIEARKQACGCVEHFVWRSRQIKKTLYENFWLSKSNALHKKDEFSIQ